MDLNEPYLQMNTEYLRTGKSRDYFSSMGPPEAPAPPVPTYVNTGKGAESGSPADNSYLKMSPNTGKVFYGSSPTETDGAQLNQINLSDAMFKTSPPANNFDKKQARQSRKPEEMPMLKHINELAHSSDSETETPVDDGGSPPKTDNRNYVNVPSSMGGKPPAPSSTSPFDIERGYSSKDAFSNPTYLGLKSYSDKKNKS